MDAQRALLDELMGRNRDGDRPQEEITDFRDSRVCKRFLCGLCPHDLFQNTKMDLGECQKLHLPKIRTAYEEEKKRNHRDYGYETELLRELERYVSDVEKKITRAQKRLEEQDGVRAPSLVDIESNKEVLEITAEIADLMQKAEDAGNEGEVDKSMELMARVEILKLKKSNLQSNPSTRSDAVVNEYDATQMHLMNLLPGNPLAMTNVNQKLRVCDMCGAFLSIFDSDRRLADHFGGKMHLGYMQIRKKIVAMKAAKEEAAAAAAAQQVSTEAAEVSVPTSTQPTDNERPRRLDSDARGRSRSNSRDRNRRGSKRDRSRERSRDRSRERNRRRSRSRSRDRRRSVSIMNQDDCVHVCVRIRPTSKKEKLDTITGNNCVRVPPSANGAPPTQLIVGKDRPFTFDIIHNSETTQDAMYSSSVTTLGYNATVLAYGQTGTGKTYTMTGGAAYSTNIQESHGVIPRAVCHVFKLMREKAETTEFLLRIEYLEIYNEELRDLLHPETTSKQLSIREDAEGHIIVAGAKAQAVQGPDDVMRLLSMGSAARVTGSTNMNEQSSRSHAIFSLVLQQKRKGTSQVTQAKFHLVDLAGSERAKRTGAVGGRFKESVNINQGLLALGNVISALGDDTKKKAHVPYRDSKLTRLLQDSLGGNSKTLMIACVSPVASNFEETLNTLKYANRAKNIKNRPVVNHLKEAEQVDTIERMKQEIEMLQSQLVKPPSSPPTPAVNTEEIQEQQRTIEELTVKQKALRRSLQAAKVTAKDSATGLVALERDIKTLGRPVQQRLSEIVKLLNGIVKMKTVEEPEQPEDDRTEETPSDVEHYRVEIESLKGKLKQDVEIFEMKSKEVDICHEKIAQLERDLHTLRSKNTEMEVVLQSTALRSSSTKGNQDSEEQKQVGESLFRNRRIGDDADDDNVLLAEVTSDSSTSNTILNLQQEIIELKMELKQAQETKEAALFTTKDPSKVTDSKIAKLSRAQSARPGHVRSIPTEYPVPPKTADPSYVHVDKTSVHAMFQTQLLAAVESHVKQAQVASMLHAKEETTKHKNDISLRKQGLEMEKLRQSLSVQSSITDLSQTIQAMNKKLTTTDPEEIRRLKRRKERAEKKLALFVQKIDNQSYVEPAVQEELNALEEQIEDLNSQILFQDAQLETAQAYMTEELKIDHLVKHVGGESIDPKLKTWIQMCWSELVKISVQMKTVQENLQHQEELVIELTQNRLQLENGLNAARTEYDRRLLQYELLQTGDRKQIDELTILLADKQNEMDQLYKNKRDENNLNQIKIEKELNQLKIQLNQEYEKYKNENKNEWENKLNHLQEILINEQEKIKKFEENINQNKIIQEKLNKQQEYIINLEKHVLLFKNKAKQTQLQLQQLIRDSSNCNQNSDENKMEERMKQLEELNESLMKENASMKVHVRGLKQNETTEPHVRVRIAKSELKEIEIESKNHE